MTLPLAVQFVWHCFLSIDSADISCQNDVCTALKFNLLLILGRQLKLLKSVSIPDVKVIVRSPDEEGSN